MQEPIIDQEDLISTPNTGHLSLGKDDSLEVGIKTVQDRSVDWAPITKIEQVIKNYQRHFRSIDQRKGKKSWLQNFSPRSSLQNKIQSEMNQ